jgi:hypothetical protein
MTDLEVTDLINLDKLKYMLIKLIFPFTGLILTQVIYVESKILCSSMIIMTLSLSKDSNLYNHF